MDRPSSLTLFKMDAARWIRPQEIADLAEVTPRAVARALYTHRSLRAMALLRLGSWLKSRRIPGAHGFVQRLIFRRFGLEISPGADIGGGLYIAHPSGTTIVAERIGVDVTVIHAVTVGMRNTARWPRIGDRVFIGAGARVLGDIDIGDDARIGANAVVVDDVAAGATVVGIPARQR
ncbi:MAG: serine O-acetyltransferase [Acidimicrobiia bacterium]